MAIGEQFVSRPITHTPTGSVGQRVFVVEWKDRYLSTLPKIGDQWPADPLHSPAFREGLWLHEVVPTPYAASGTPATNNNVATHVRLEYNYQSTQPLTTEADGWLISANSVVSTAEIGRERSFTENPANKLDGGRPRQVPMAEVVIRGLEFLGSPEKPSTKELAEATEAAQGRLGRVCQEIYQPRGGFDNVEGQVLFESEDTSEAFMQSLQSQHLVLTDPLWPFKVISMNFGLLVFAEQITDLCSTMLR